MIAPVGCKDPQLQQRPLLANGKVEPMPDLGANRNGRAWPEAEWRLWRE
jgi:hypothetical protein